MPQIKVNKVKIDAFADREKMVSALANSGYPVWIEEKNQPTKVSNDFYVCFELTPKEQSDD